MKVSTAFRHITVALAVVVALSTLMTWMDPFKLSLVEWQELSSRIGGGIAWDAWAAVACGVVVGLIARSSSSVVAAFTSVGLSIAGITLLGIFLNRITERFGTGELFGVGPIVAGVALLAMYVSSLIWAVSTPKKERVNKLGPVR